MRVAWRAPPALTPTALWAPPKYCGPAADCQVFADTPVRCGSSQTPHSRSFRTPVPSLKIFGHSKNPSGHFYPLTALLQITRKTITSRVEDEVDPRAKDKTPSTFKRFTSAKAQKSRMGHLVGLEGARFLSILPPFFLPIYTLTEMW